MQMEGSSEDDKFARIAQSIRTSTTLLSNSDFVGLASPLVDPGNPVPQALNALAILLTTGEELDLEAQRVTAVTAPVDDTPGALPTPLLVTRNPLARRDTSGDAYSLSLNKDSRKPCIDENGAGNHPCPVWAPDSLEARVQDVLAVLADDKVQKQGLSAITADDKAQVQEALAVLADNNTALSLSDEAISEMSLKVLEKSIFKFTTRFKYHRKTWDLKSRGTPFYKEIENWTPSESSTDWPKAHHAKMPNGLLDCDVNHEDFSKIFHNSLPQLRDLVCGQLSIIDEQFPLELKGAHEGDPVDQKPDLVAINEACLTLTALHQRGILELLITKTSLKEKLDKSLETPENVDRPPQELPSDQVSDQILRAGPVDKTSGHIDGSTEERPSEQVYGFLKKVLSWHSAVSVLFCLRIGGLSLVKWAEKVPYGAITVGLGPGTSDLYPLEEVAAKLCLEEPEAPNTLSKTRRNQARVYNSEASKKFTEWYQRGKFASNTIHAECILMGLLRRSKGVDDSLYGVALDQGFDGALEELLPKGDHSSAIGVGKKCCWTCHWLGKKINSEYPNPIRLPGTSGMMWPWSPPFVGVNVGILQELDDVLWKLLVNRAVASLRPPPRRPNIRRQSSGISLWNQDPVVENDESRIIPTTTYVEEPEPMLTRRRDRPNHASAWRKPRAHN